MGNTISRCEHSNIFLRENFRIRERDTTTKGEEMLGLATPHWTSPFVRAGMPSRSVRTKFLEGKIYFSKENA